MTTSIGGYVGASLPATYARSDINPNDARFGGGIPISSRCLWTGPQGVTTANWSAANTPATFRQRHPLIYDATNIRVVFFGYGQSGQSAHDGEENPNNTSGAESFTTLTVRCGLEAFLPGTGGNITYPFTFNGLKTLTLDPGGIAISDPLGVHLQAATQSFFYIRTFVTTANQYPLGVQPLASDNEGFVATTDLTGYNAVGGFAGGGNQFQPWLVLGHTSPRNRVVVGIVGDSIIQGSKNQQADGATISTTTNDRGPAQQALGTTYPFINIARDSDLASTFANTRLTQARHAVIALCSHAIIAYGRNDLANSVAAATVYASLKTICTYARLQGAKAVLCTILPETTSSDSWVTAVNQTVNTHEAARVSLNALIRGSVAAGDADIMVDWCAPYEVNSSNVLTQDGGRIISNGVTKHYSWDGIHPSNAGNALFGTAFHPSVFTL